MAEAATPERLTLRRGQPLVNSIELAWAAGFFDGEGCTMCMRSSAARRERGWKSARLTVQVGQVDRRHLYRLRDAVGVGRLNGPYERQGKNQRPISYWRTHGKEAGQALSLLWPYLSEPKREQAKAVLKRLGEYNRA